MRVVVFGAGYAGLTAARRLESSLPADVELVVVNESAEHLVQHELHRVIRHPEVAEKIVVPLDAVLDRAEVRRGRVTAVDPDASVATLDGGKELSYDYAAVCLGAETEFYGLPGVAEHARPLKRLDDARRIREDVLGAPDGGQAVVGGAGLTGVQVAGELAELATELGDGLEVVLLEALSDVAPGFSPEFQAAIREELERRGVEIRTGARVMGATAERVELEEGSIGYDAFVWTGGIRGSSALSGERPVVRGTLRLGGGTFVVGDAARVIDRDGEAVTASAQAAVREGRTAARNITRLVRGARNGGGFEPRLKVFDFEPRAWIVSVGDGAVAQVGPAVLRGAPARALKASAGARYLTSVGAVGEAVDLVRGSFGGELRTDR